MTQPRMCLPGTTYMVTRSVHNRQFLLRPSPIVNRVVMYCAARAALATGVELHWIFVHTNHMHLGLTDPDASVSRFMHAMDLNIARCLTAHYEKVRPTEHLDGVWSKGKFSKLALLTPKAVLQEMAYSLLNPVKDGLVADYRKWPGLCSRPGDWAEGTRDVMRPELFFKQDAEEWENVPCTFTVPPMLRDRPSRQAIADAEALLHDEQRGLQAKRAGKGFAGVNAVLRTDPFGSPNSPRPKGKRNPTVAAGGDSKMRNAAIQLLRSFRELYREAWRAYRDGELDVLFPAGTLKMRLLHHARCDTVDVPWCAATLAPA